MAKSNFGEKFKKGVSVADIEGFAKKRTNEVFIVLALVIGAISSAFHFFTGPFLSLLLMAIGALAGIFFPNEIDRILKQLHGFASKQEKTTQLVLGAVEIVVGIFIPFVLFALFGLLSGTSFHYYTRHAQINEENRPSKGGSSHSGDEHD